MPNAQRPLSHPSNCGCLLCGKCREEAATEREEMLAALEDQARAEDGVSLYAARRSALFRAAREIVAKDPLPLAGSWPK